MKTAESFEVLGLPPSATEQEIEARFRSLAKERHPDSGGSNEAMQRLNQARDVARAAATRRQTLVSADVVRDIVVATTTALAVRAEAAQELQVISARIKLTLTGRLKSMRQFSTLFGGVSAAALFVGKDLPDKFLGMIATPEMGGTFTIAALILGMYCAIGYWFLTNRIERAERLAEELSAHLSVRSNYVAILDVITKGADNWTLNDLEHYVIGWCHAASGESNRWASLAHDVGSEDFAHLLLTKGKDLDLLKRTELTEGRLLIERFSLSFGDSRS